MEYMDIVTELAQYPVEGETGEQFWARVDAEWAKVSK